MAFLWVCIILFLVFLDQITKYLVMINMDVYDSIPIIKDVLHITYIRNEGAAFGSLSNSRWIFMILSVVAIIAIIVYWVVKKPNSKMLQVIMTLCISGGIGNMIDRVRLGYVVDFIDFRAFPHIWKWIFNVADSCVTISAALFIVWMILDTVKTEKAKKAQVSLEGTSDSVSADDVSELADSTEEIQETEEKANEDNTVSDNQTDSDTKNSDIDE